MENNGTELSEYELDEIEEKPFDIQFLLKLDKQLVNFDAITKTEVRFLVDNYYMIQKQRIIFFNQKRELGDEEIELPFQTWLGNNFQLMENNIKAVLQEWVKRNALGKRLLSICGIGPVLAAGLLAHIDFKKALGAQAVWRFAGLDPTLKWEKGKKRPFNASLKTLCWKVGQSFMKVQNRPKDFYGKFYRSKKDFYIAKNAIDGFKELALERAQKVGKTTEAYKHYSEGKLPPGHIDAMARRWAVKLFLSHLHEAGFILENGVKPPCYFETLPGHTHKIEVPF